VRPPLLTWLGALVLFLASASGGRGHPAEPVHGQQPGDPPAPLPPQPIHLSATVCPPTTATAFACTLTVDNAPLPLPAGTYTVTLTPESAAIFTTVTAGGTCAVSPPPVIAPGGGSVTFTVPLACDPPSTVVLSERLARTAPAPGAGGICQDLAFGGFPLQVFCASLEAAGPVTAAKLCTMPTAGLVVPCRLTIAGVFAGEVYTVTLTQPAGAGLLASVVAGSGGTCTAAVTPTGPTTAQVTTDVCPAGGGTLVVAESVTLPAALAGHAVTICQAVAGVRGLSAPVCAAPLTLPTPPPRSGLVTLCHQPGTPAQMTLTLPAPAVPGHLRHGDTRGACPTGG